MAAAAARATWVLSLEAGEILARGGDDAKCDATAELYIVKDGSLELLAPRGGDSLARIGLKKRGDADGEAALVGGVPRTVTLAAATRARVWVLSRPAFRAAAAATRGSGGVNGVSASPAAGAAVFLSDGVPLLAPLDASARARVARAAVVARHPPGGVVVAAGEPATHLIVTWTGEATVVKADGSTTRMFAGDCVGAPGLLTHTPHTDSLLATTHVTTLTIDAATFDEVVAPALVAGGSGAPPSPSSASPPAPTAEFRIKRRRPDGSWTVTKCTGRGDDARALGATPRAPGGRPRLTLVDGPPLGTGTFSRVTLATDPSTGRRFALKRMLKTAVAPCPEHVWSERAVARGAVHPFCVRTYAAFQSPTYLFLLSDALPGGDLMDVLAADARVVRGVAPGLGGAVAAALAPRCGARAPPPRPARPPRTRRPLLRRLHRAGPGPPALARRHLQGFEA